jgi:hypothetical protein
MNFLTEKNFHDNRVGLNVVILHNDFTGNIGTFKHGKKTTCRTMLYYN